MLPDLERIREELKGEFLQDCREKLYSLDEILCRFDSGDGETSQLVSDFKLLVHSLKGSAGSFGFASVSHIAHALEDYIAPLGTDSPIPSTEAGHYLKVLSEIIESGRDLGEEKAVALIRKLPTHAADTDEDGPERSVALLHIPEKVWSKIMSEELSRLGLRISNASTPIEAIDCGLTLKPALFVTSMQLHRMTGIELAEIFKTLAMIGDTRILILASRPQKELDALSRPDNTSFLEKGPDYRTGLENWFERVLS
ncbi:Hpt domain-containing protein [Aestuariispira insulae]|uniref:Hpt domain-containing protein n=1 Tax=Aestuariispira insulae TaxID=1461337 RepID=A0A3D9HWM7_9PROT|nr:Hpt domain-containing protein [Aestuariispira insulae]RED53819.1 Hpt domain-containing protein [Aestuariispira insulae]